MHTPPASAATDPQAVQRTRGAPLGLDVRFEVALATRLVQGTALAAQVLPLLDHDSFSYPPARLLLETILAGARQKEEPPRTTLQALQRLQRRVQDKGDCTSENVREVASMFASVLMGGAIDDAAIIAELRPVLKKRAVRDQLDQALEATALGQDVVFSTKRIDSIERLGSAPVDRTTRWGVGALDVIEAAGSIELLSTGVQEIDEMLDGGKPRGTLCVTCADSGGGKSMMLAQEATAGLISGAFVGFVTVELPKAIQFARMKACMTGIPTKTIQHNPKAPHIVDLISLYASVPTFGALAMCDMDPKRTDPAAIFEWVIAQEQAEGRAMDLLVVDYADKLVPYASGGPARRGDKNTNQEQGDVYDQLYVWARDGNRWLSTASQAGRRPEGGSKKKILTGHNVADSINKVRTSDIFITLNPEDNFMMRARLDKFRLGEGDKTSSPFPRDFSCARIGPFPLADALLASVRRGVRDIDL